MNAPAGVARPGGRLPLALLAGFAIALAAYAVASGQVVSWDLRNYHWYSAWAWLEGRPQDLAPAQLQSYFNPLLHVPFYWLATHVPPRAAVFALALVQAGNAFGVFAIARHVLPPTPHRAWLALAAAAVGALGSAQLLELGATMGDNLLSLGLLAALASLLPSIVDGAPRRAAWLVAGALAGAMVGLKPSCAPIALGCFAASAFAGRGARGRVAAMAIFATSAVAGLLLAGGAWSLHLWREYGNPLHPFFAAVFGSEWLPPYGSGDARYHVQGVGDALLRPWAMVHDWRRTSELRFRDLRVPVLLVLVLAWPWLRQRAAPAPRRAIDALCAAFIVTWLAWLLAFGYYRYLATWELLAPALAVAIVTQVTRRAAVAPALLVFLVVTTNVPEVPHVPFAQRFLQQQSPALTRTAPSLVLLAGDSPMAYVLPGIGAQHAYVRVSGNYAGWPQPRWRADEAIAARIDGDDSPLLLLHQSRDTAAIAPALARFGVVMDDGNCEVVATSWAVADEPPIQLCRAKRIARARDALRAAAHP